MEHSIQAQSPLPVLYLSLSKLAGRSCSSCSSSSCSSSSVTRLLLSAVLILIFYLYVCLFWYNNNNNNKSSLFFFHIFRLNKSSSFIIQLIIAQLSLDRFISKHLASHSVHSTTTTTTTTTRLFSVVSYHSFACKFEGSIYQLLIV